MEHVPRQRLSVSCIHVCETLLDGDRLLLWLPIRSGLPPMVVQLLEDLVDLLPVRTLVILFSLVVLEVGEPRLRFIAARQVAHTTFISLAEVILLLIDFLFFFEVVAIVLRIL